MKPEPLDLNETKITKWVKSDLVVKEGDVDRAIKMTLSRIKQRIKSACEFYLRYKDDPLLFWQEHPEYRKDFEKHVKNVYANGDRFWQKHPIKYNDWLFKLAFLKVG